MARLRRWFPGAVLQGLNSADGTGPKDYREAPAEGRWPALLSAVEEGLAEWNRRKLGTDPSGRQEIVVRPPEHEVVKDALEALDRRGGYYLRGQRLIYVWKYRGQKKGIPLRIPAGSPIIREASPHWLREQLSRCARFVKETQEGLTRDCLIPEWLPPMVLVSSKLQALPLLQALVEVPILLPDGSILAERADSTRAAHSALIHALHEEFEMNPFTSEQILEFYMTHDTRYALLIEAIDDLNVNPKGLSSRSLGRILLRAIGAVHGGWRLDLQQTKWAGSRVWILHRVACVEATKGFGGIEGSPPFAPDAPHPPLAEAVGAP